MAAKYKIIHARYEFSKHGGGTGTTFLAYIPKGMIVNRLTISQATALAPCGANTRKTTLHINNTLISTTGATCGNKTLWATGTTYLNLASGVRKKQSADRKLKICHEDGPKTAGAYDIFIEGII